MLSCFVALLFNAFEKEFNQHFTERVKALEYLFTAPGIEQGEQDTGDAAAMGGTGTQDIRTGSLEYVRIRRFPVRTRWNISGNTCVEKISFPALTDCVLVFIFNTNLIEYFTLVQKAVMSDMY